MGAVGSSLWGPDTALPLEDDSAVTDKGMTRSLQIMIKPGQCEIDKGPSTYRPIVINSVRHTHNINAGTMAIRTRMDADGRFVRDSISRGNISAVGDLINSLSDLYPRRPLMCYRLKVITHRWEDDRTVSDTDYLPLDMVTGQIITRRAVNEHAGVIRRIRFRNTDRKKLLRNLLVDAANISIGTDIEAYLRNIHHALNEDDFILRDRERPPLRINFIGRLNDDGSTDCTELKRIIAAIFGEATLGTIFAVIEPSERNSTENGCMRPVVSG